MVTQIDNYDQVDVFVGLDVGKGEHHAVALDRGGKKLYDRALPNDERRLRAVLADLQEHGVVLLIVDQPATIGALPIAVAQAAGALVGYLPGLAMRRIADLHPGEAKTDARDAAIIAETARTMPHTLRSIHATDEQVAELTMLCGFDDLAAQIAQVGNRIRGLLTQIHPALERAIGPRLDHPAILDLLQRWPSPAQLRAAGEKRIATRMMKLAPRKGRDWAHEITTALDQQSVVVTGTNAAALVIPRLAAQLATLRTQRDEVAAEVERLVDAHPLQPVLTSMPGVGVRTAARLLTEVAGNTSPRPDIWPLTLASRPSPEDLAPRSEASTHRDAGTRSSRRRCSSPRSPPPAIPTPHLLRPQDRPRQTAQPGAACSRQTPIRRPLRHAPRRHPLPAAASRSGDSTATGGILRRRRAL